MSSNTPEEALKNGREGQEQRREKPFLLSDFCQTPLIKRSRTLFGLGKIPSTKVFLNTLGIRLILMKNCIGLILQYHGRMRTYSPLKHELGNLNVIAILQEEPLV